MALVKLPGAIGKTKVLGYSKNVARSFGYALYDMVSEANPVIKEIIENTKDAAEDLYNDIDRIKSDETNQKYIGQVRDGSKAIFTNLLDDLKTGNWYNKARQKQMEESMSESLMGDDDFGADFGGGEDWGDDWDSDSDDNWDTDDDSWDEEDTAKAVVSEQEKSANKIINAMDSVGFGVATAVNQGTIQSANYVAESGRANTRALLKSNAAGFSMMSSAINSMNANMTNLAKLIEPLSTHMQNSATFFTNTTEQLNRITGHLEKIEANTTPKQSKSNTDTGTSFSSLLSADDVLDVSSWYNMIKKNLKDDKELMDQATNIIKSIDPSKMSIGTIMTSMITNAVIPKIFSESLKGFNETLKYTINATFLKGRGKLEESFIGSLISQYIFPESRFKTRVSSSKYEKGPISWDGYAKKALTDVIPKTLFKILSAITGEDELRYDYEKGQFINAGRIKKERDKELKEAYQSAGGEYREDALSLVKERYGGHRNYKKIVQAVEDYFEWAIVEGRPTELSEFLDSSYGKRNPLSPYVVEVFNELRSQYKAAGIASGSYNIANKFITDVETARGKISQQTDYYEETGLSVLTTLVDGSYTDKNGKTKKISRGLKEGSTGIRELFGKDKYGNTIMNYMQGIFQYTEYIANNIGGVRSKRNRSKKGSYSPVKLRGLPNTMNSKFMNYRDREDKRAQEKETARNFLENRVRSRINPMNNGIEYYMTTEDGKERTISLEYVNRIRKNAGYQPLKKNQNKKETLEKINEQRKEASLPPITESEYVAFDVSKEEKQRIKKEAKDDAAHWIDKSTGRKYKKGIGSVFDYTKDKIMDYFDDNGVNIRSISNAPFEAAAGLITTLSNSMSDIIWGKNGKLDDGLFGSFKEKAEQAFDWAKEAWEKHWDKDLSGLFEKLFGKKQKDGSREGGFFSNLIEETKVSLGDGLKYIKKSIGNHWYGRRYEQIKQAYDAEQLADERITKYRQNKANLQKVGFYSSAPDVASEADYVPLKSDKEIEDEERRGINTAAYGQKVTKSGLVAVSKGEMIIPSEFNPFYHGKTNKRAQILDERRIVNNFLGAYADGTTAVGTKPKYDIKREREYFAWRNEKHKKIKELENKIANTEIFRQEAIDERKRLKRQAYTYDEEDITGAGIVGGIKDIFKNTITETLSRIVGDKEDVEKTKKTIFKKSGSIIDEATGNKGAIGAGALIGVGTSLLTGALVGPLAGAAIGSAVGLTVKSKKVQEVLFGEIDEETGEREGGFFSKEVSNFLTKNLPKMSMGGVTGLVGGAFLGSPVLGAILGSTVGYVASSQKARDYLFGGRDKDGKELDDGVIKKDTLARIKKAIPSMGAGALAGLLIGPFGIPGNLMIGAGLGYLASSQNVHDKLFGKESDDTDNGLMGEFKTKVVDKMAELVMNTGKAVTNWLSRTGKRLTTIFLGVGKGLLGIGSGILKGLFGGSKFGGKILSFLSKGFAGVITGGLKGLANRSKLVGARKGYGVWDAEKGRNLTAEETLEMIGSDEFAGNRHVRKLAKNSAQMSVYAALGSIQDKNQLDEFRSAGRALDQYKYFGKELSPEHAATLRKFGIDVFGEDGKIDKSKLKKINTTSLRQLANNEKARLNDPEYKTEKFQDKVSSTQETIVKAVSAISDSVAGTNLSDSLKDAGIKPAEKKENAEGGLIQLAQDADGNPNTVSKGESNDEYVDAEGLKHTADGTVDKTDPQNKEKLEEKQTTKDAMISNIGTFTQTKRITELLENIHNGGSGDDEEKKKSFLEEFMENSGLGIVIKGITGTFSKIGSAIVSGITATVSALGPAALMYGVASGKFDKFFEDISNNKLMGGYQSEILGDSYMDSDSTTTVTGANGEQIGIQTDENGNPITDGNGHVMGSDGQWHDINEMSTATSKHNLSWRANTNFIKQVARGRWKKTLYGTAINRVLKTKQVKGIGNAIKNATKARELKRLIGKEGMDTLSAATKKAMKRGGSSLSEVAQKQIQAKATKLASEGAEKAAKQGTKVKFLTKFKDALKGIKDLMLKFLKKEGANGAEAVARNLDDALEVVAEEMAEGAAKKFAREGAEALTSKASKFIPFVGWALTAADVANAWGNVYTNLGIIPEVAGEATFGMRCFSMLLGLIESYIPIDLFISNEKLSAFFLNIPLLQDIFGIEGLDQMQMESAMYVDKYNKEHNTDYTVETWNIEQGNSGFYSKIAKAVGDIKKNWNLLDKEDKIQKAKKDAVNKDSNAKMAEAIGKANGVDFANYKTKSSNKPKAKKKKYNEIKVDQSIVNQASAIYDDEKKKREEAWHSAAETYEVDENDPYYQQAMRLQGKGFIGGAGDSASKSILRTVDKHVKEVSSADNADLGSFASGLSKMSSASKGGRIADVVRVDFRSSGRSSISNMMSALFNITKVIDTAYAVFNHFGNKGKEIVSKIQETLSPLLNRGSSSGSTITFTSARNSFLSKVSKKFKDIKSKDKKGKGFYVGGSFLQTDPTYAGLPFGSGTFGDQGCGPGAAINFARANGIDLTPEEAIAASAPYQADGGTRASYFEDLFGMQGTTNRDQILNQLGGGSMILYGEDRSNTSKIRSPFKNPHYVVAHGIRNGKVIVEDSETGIRAYNKNILNHVKYAVGAGFIGGAASEPNVTQFEMGGVKMVKFKDGTTMPLDRYQSLLSTDVQFFDAGGVRMVKLPNGEKISYDKYQRQKLDDKDNLFNFMNKLEKRKHKRNIASKTGNGNTASGAIQDNTTEGQIWAFFQKMGYSDAAIAGILGNAWQESGFRNDAIQHGNSHAAGLFQWERYDLKSNRFANLLKVAEQRGTDWTDLETQLIFANQEMHDKGTVNWAKPSTSGNNAKPTTIEQFMQSTDVEQATNDFEGSFERAGKPNMPNRVAKAKEMYERFTGKTIQFNGDTSGTYSTADGTSSSGGVNGGTEETYDTTSLGGILSTLSSFFTALFTGSSGSGSASSGSVDSSTMASGGDYNFSGNSPSDLMKQNLGKFSYSQSHPTNQPDQTGHSDCSGTVRWAIQKATNGAVDIGAFSEPIYTNRNNLKDIWYNNGQTYNEPTMPAEAKKDDVLLFQRDGSRKKDGVGHVGLYLGNNEYIDHGGPKPGPNIKQYHGDPKYQRILRIARVIGLPDENAETSSTTEETTSGSGGDEAVLFGKMKGRTEEQQTALLDKIASGKLNPGELQARVKKYMSKHGVKENKALRDLTGLPFNKNLMAQINSLPTNKYVAIANYIKNSVGSDNGDTNGSNTSTAKTNKNQKNKQTSNKPLTYEEQINQYMKEQQEKSKSAWWNKKIGGTEDLDNLAKKYGSGSGLVAAGSGLGANPAARALLRRRPADALYKKASQIKNYIGGAAKAAKDKIQDNFVKEVRRSDGTVSASPKTNMQAVQEVISAIVELLTAISNNTMPVRKIYELLESSLASGGKLSKETEEELRSTKHQTTKDEKDRLVKKANKANKALENEEVSNSFKNLITKLTEIAQG